MTPVRPDSALPVLCVHFTERTHLEDIMRDGLIPGGPAHVRQHVHFATSTEYGFTTLREKASRTHGVAIFLDLGKWIDNGNPACLTAADVVCIPETVNSSYFSHVIDLSSLYDHVRKRTEPRFNLVRHGDSSAWTVFADQEDLDRLRQAAVDNYSAWASRDRVVTEVGDPRSGSGISEETYEQQITEMPETIRQVQAPRPPPMRPNLFAEIDARLGGAAGEGPSELTNFGF